MGMVTPMTADTGIPTQATKITTVTDTITLIKMITTAMVTDAKMTM
jgi:hypothetical protein